MNTATYKNKIIKFCGGVRDYVGELQHGPHPNGAYWYRILKPCVSFTQQNPVTKKVQLTLASLRGINNTYEQFIDIYVPPDSIIEVLVADKTGDLYEVYQAEIKKKKGLIELPGNSKVVGIGGGISRN